MDNEAFRSLVHERTREKSSKEIAREAVQEEFNRKRKRRKGRDNDGGGSSDSDDGHNRKRSNQKRRNNDDDDDDSDGNTDDNDKNKRNKRFGNKTKSKDKVDDRYRDRAKERREGKNTDYAASEDLLQGIRAAAQEGQNNEAELSKYLGGDEAHTHLVKGLDVALARRVKQEMGQLLDQRMDVSTAMRKDKRDAKKRRKHLPQPMATKEEATVFLQQRSVDSFGTELAKRVFGHLRKAHGDGHDKAVAAIQGPTPAGMALQRSSFLFSTRGDPRQQSKAWEIPQEMTNAGLRKGDGVDGQSSGMPVLTSGLLARIRKACSPRTPDNDNETMAMKKNESIAGGTGGKDHGQGIVGNNDDDDDSDDDIFADTGDYVPPTADDNNNNNNNNNNNDHYDDNDKPKPRDKSTDAGESLQEKKRSIFAGLVSSKEDNDDDAATSKAPVIQLPRARRKEPPTNRPAGNFSLASARGDYGEEMDVDFDGRMDAEDEEDGKSKKNKDELTMASKEYGRRGKPLKDSYD